MVVLDYLPDQTDDEVPWIRNLELVDQKSTDRVPLEEGNDDLPDVESLRSGIWHT